jgi:hypothetical protein
VQMMAMPTSITDQFSEPTVWSMARLARDLGVEGKEDEQGTSIAVR